jgi:hypothetical protein
MLSPLFHPKFAHRPESQFSHNLTLRAAFFANLRNFKNAQIVVTGPIRNSRTSNEFRAPCNHPDYHLAPTNRSYEKIEIFANLTLRIFFKGD